MSVSWNQRRRNAAIIAAVGAAVGASLSSSALATSYYWSDNSNDHLWDTSNPTFGSNWAPSEVTIGSGTTMRGNANGDFPNNLTSDAFFLAGNVNTNVNLHGQTFTVNKLQFGRDVPVDVQFSGDTYKIGTGTTANAGTLNFNQIVSAQGVAAPDPQVTGSGINTINSRLVPTVNGAVQPTVVVNGGILVFNNSNNDLTGTTVTVNAGGTFAPTGGSDTVHESSFGASIHLNGGTFKAIAADAGAQTGQLTDYIFTNKDSVNATANAGLAPGGINSLVAFAGGRGYDAVRPANQGMTYDLARNGVTGNDGVNGNTGPYSTATLGAQYKGGSQANISTLTLGQLTVSTANTYTFGSRSDDGSVVYIDLNKNGSFESNELIVNNNFDQGYTNRQGNATLAIGTYNIALGWYQGTCCDNNGVEFRVGPGGGLGYNNSAMVVINPAAPLSGLAFSTTSGLLAGYNNTDLTVDNDSIVDISQGGSTRIRSLVLGSGKNLTVNGLGTLSVTPSSGSAMAGGGTNTIFANSNVQLNGVVSGTTLLKKAGGGKLILNASSPAFTGNFQVDAGTLTVAADKALGSAAAGQTVLVNSGGQLQFSMPSGATYTANQGVTINGNGPGTTGALSGNQNNTFPGKVTLGSASYITSSANTLTLTGGVDTTAAGFALRIGGGGAVNTDNIGISGAANVRKTEGGSWSIHATNTYTGTTTMDGGTINADAVNSFGPTTGAPGLVQINSGTVNSKITNALAGKTINVVNGGTLAIPAPFVGTDARVDSNAASISLGVNNIIPATILFNAGSGKTGSFTNPATPVTIPVDNNGLIRAQSGVGDMSNTTINATPRIINLSFSGGNDRVFFKGPTQADIDPTGINTVTTAAPPAPGFQQAITYPLTYDTARIANTGVDGNNGQYSTAAPRFTGPNPDASNSKQANIEIGITGTIHVGKDGTYTFGTRSDDGSTLFVDLNNSGTFDATEMVVNNNNFQGYTNRIGTATLSATNAGPGGAGNYKIGVGFYQGGCCTNNGLEVRYGVGNLTDYNTLSVVDPNNPISGGGARIQTDAGATLIVGSTLGKPDGFFSGTLQYSAKAAPTAHTLGGVNVQSQTAVIDTLTNNNVTADVLNVVNAANLTKKGPGTLTVTTPVTLRGGKITASGGVMDLSSGVLTAAPVVAGLIETQLSGSFNTAAFTPSNTLKSGPLKGNETSPANFPDNTTFAYTGRVYVPDNGAVGDGQGQIAFAENFDDNVLVRIDGVDRLNNTSWNTPTGTGALSLSVGYHDFEVRFGEGGGGVGPNTGAPASTHWSDNTAQFPFIGFGIDLTDPVDNTTTNPDRELYVFPDNGLSSDPVYGPLLAGNPLFAQFGGGSIQVDQGGTLLVGGTAGQLDGTLNGGTLQYTNAAAATSDQLGTLTVSNLATSGAPATINVGTNHSVTVGSVNLFGVLSKTGAGLATITQANVLAGQTGGLDAQTALAVTTLNVTGTLNSTGPGSLTVGTTNLAGGGTVVKAGSGATTLQNVSVVSGQTGTLTAQLASTLNATNVTVGGTLNTSGAGNVNITGTVGGAGTLSNSSSALTISATQNWLANSHFNNTGGAAALNTNAGTPATAGAAAVANLQVAVSGGTVTLGSPQQLKDLSVTGGTYNLNGKRTEVYPADATGRAAVEASLYQSIRAGTLTDSTLASPNAIGITDQAHNLHGDPMVLVKLTRGGDANVDNTVDVNDLGLLAQNYGNSSGTATWDQGDFTKDGNVNVNDLGVLAQNYQQSFSGSNLVAQLSAAGFSASAQFVSDAEAVFSGAAVPEPASLGLLGLGAVGLLARRRRRQA